MIKLRIRKFSTGQCTDKKNIYIVVFKDILLQQWIYLATCCYLEFFLQKWNAYNSVGTESYDTDAIYKHQNSINVIFK